MEKILKICSKHGELNESGVRGGVYKGKKYLKCRQCEIDRAREYTKKIYEDAEKIKKKHANDKKRWETKKNEITLQRQKPESLEKRRDAYKKLAPRYREKCNEKQKKYREELHDSYVKKVIQNGNKSIKFDAIPQGMINLKRSIMMLKKSISRKNIIGDNVDDHKECGTIKKHGN